MMKNEFLGSHLDKTGEEIFVYFSDKVTQSPAMSLLFTTYADLLDKNLARQKFYWDRINNAVIVWAENKNKRVLSGIIFDFEKSVLTVNLEICLFLVLRKALLAALLFCAKRFNGKINKTIRIYLYIYLLSIKYPKV